MDIPKYDGNVHPDEWINEIQKCFKFRQINYEKDYDEYVKIAILLVDSAIKLPARINNFEELVNALKEDISFMIFKITNEEKLQSLRYIPESEGGDTSKFIPNFRKLCYNAEINEIEKQKKYFYQSFTYCSYNDYFLTELFKRKEKINSMNELIKEFEEIVADKLNIIYNGSTVALKHVATGKYLTSIVNLHYTTGNKTQLVIAESLKPDENSLWRIYFISKIFATYTDARIYLQHIKSQKFLGIYYRDHHKSTSYKHTEVCCTGFGYDTNTDIWKFNHSKLENHQGYLKLHDTINLSIKKQNGQEEFLRSHDIQFTIGNDTFQEVVCHNERLGENDEWLIEFIN